MEIWGRKDSVITELNRIDEANGSLRLSSMACLMELLAIPPRNRCWRPRCHVEPSSIFDVSFQYSLRCDTPHLWPQIWISKIDSIWINSTQRSSSIGTVRNYSSLSGCWHFLRSWYYFALPPINESGEFPAIFLFVYCCDLRIF